MLTAKFESIINMDREEQPNQQTTPPPPLLAAKLEDSPRKPTFPVVHGGVGGSGGGVDRLKRDEWSEGAVSTLLEAYEAKWILRNRAKLKGQDWEEVARFVSSRASSTKSPKTQTQCKNKIESMKKRYRSESSVVVDPASPSASTWPLYHRLDLLLRGTALSPQPLLPPHVPPPLPPLNAPMILVPPPHQQLPQFLPITPVGVAAAQNSRESNGVEDRVAKEDAVATKVLEDHLSSDKAPVETDSSTPAQYSDDEEEKEKSKSKKKKTTTTTSTTTKDKKRKKRSREDWDIAESIRWLADVVIRTEQARMETMRELEKMRAEAEAKRAEIDLKRTEIIANTQLEIAKLFAGGTTSKSLDSSLRIGRN